MRSIMLFVVVTFLCANSNAQNNYQSLDTIKPYGKVDNIYVRKLYTDSSNVSSFVIFVFNEVKAHKHEAHTEQVVVLAGKGRMSVGQESFMIKKGDIIYIPKNTFHSVISTSKKEPLKVLSVQAPYFDGKDRVYKE